MNDAPAIPEPEKRISGAPETALEPAEKRETRHEPLIEAAQQSPAVPEPAPQGGNPSNLPKTGGEWFYNILQQVGGKGAILAATAALGFLARYGKRWYGPIPNAFKMVNDGMHDTLFHNPLFPLAKKGEKLQRFGGAAVSTTVLFWGGAAFSPVMKWLENNRENIANWYNRKWGSPEEIEIAHERLKDKPEQNWFDIVKGRMAAWGIIFSAMAAADLALGKGNLFGKGNPDKYRFDQYEEGFGRWLAGFTKKGKEIWNTPLAKELTEAQKQNKVYQFGKITALDFYATNIGILIWSFFSRKSARKRQDGQKALADEAVKAPAPEAAEPAAGCATCPPKRFAAAETPSAGFAHAIAGEKARAAEAQLAQSV